MKKRDRLLIGEIAAAHIEEAFEHICDDDRLAWANELEGDEIEEFFVEIWKAMRQTCTTKRKARKTYNFEA